MAGVRPQGRLAILIVLVCPYAHAAAQTAKAAAAPTVVLAEAGAASGGITLADVGHPDVAIPLHWVQKNGRARIELQLEVTPLANTRGEGLAPTIVTGAAPEASSIKLEPRGLQGVTLKARLLDAGTYRALLRVTLDDGATKTALDPVPITVTRTHTMPAVEFSTASLPVEAPWFARSLSATPALAAYTSAAGGIMLAPAQLAQATRKNTMEAAAEGTATRITLAKPASGAAPTYVEPGKSTPLALELAGIPGPGRYDATVRFVSEGYKPLDTKVVVLVREPASLALFLVFVGVLMSFGIQLWGTAIKPARELRQHVAGLLELVHAARRQAGAAADDGQVRTLLDGIHSSLQQRASAAWYLRPQSAAAVNVYDAIVPALPTWISLWRQLPQVRPESVREPHRQTLETVCTLFLAQAPDPIQVAAAIQSLDQMPGKIRADVAQALGSAISKLEKSMGGDPRAVIVNLLPQLRSAAEHLASGQVEAAIGVYEQVLRGYVAEMAKTLLQRVDPALPQPPGLSPSEWQDLKRDTLVALAGVDSQPQVDQALAQLRQATQTYVQGFAAGLRRAVESRPDAIRQPVEDAAKKVDNAVADGDLVGAWNALREVQQAYALAQVLLSQAMGPDRVGLLIAATQPPGGTFDAQTSFDLPGWRTELGRPGTAAKMARRTFFGDLAISLVVLVVAGLGGLHTLWVPNLVWGGCGAYLAAILAGFAADRATQLAAAALRRVGAIS